MPGHNPIDIAIATMVDKDLKQCVATTSLSACESTSPEVRQTFSQIVQDGIRRQEQLTKLMSQKGWYVAPTAEHETISQLMPQLQAATQGLGGATAGAGGGGGTVRV